jgi:predicted O-methyltransferase YrrM
MGARLRVSGQRGWVPHMLTKLARKFREAAARKVKSRGHLRSIWYPRYEFQMSPRQLCFLADCLDKIKDVEGSIVEIGCAHGLTTTFLYEYMVHSGFKKEYVCVDTFAGFTKEDIAIEENQRGKRKVPYAKLFKDNNSDWFKESLKRRDITDVRVVEADISHFSEAKLPERIAFCLVDVDLYRPVKSALKKIYPRLSAGGMIVVDDCWSKPSYSFIPDVAEAYDGAMQAYREFADEHRLPEKLVEDKLSVIERA